jgi:DedD protein
MGLLSLFKQKQQDQRVPDDADSGEFHSRAEMESKPKRGSKKADKDAANSRNEKSDPHLPEKKRARRRLIGAVALVLAAVIGLPMILDAEQKPVSDDITIVIPSKDKAPEITKPAGKEIPAEVVEPVSPEPKVDAKPAAQPELKPEPVSDVKVETKKDVKKEVVKDSSATSKAEGKTADVKPDTKLDSKASKPAADAKTSTANSGKEEAARALAILEGKSEASASKKADGAYVVQVAALSTQDKVRALQDKLKAAGIAYFTQKVVTKSGDIIRIRVGPFATKAEAEKMLKKLSKSDLPGTLIPQ